MTRQHLALVLSLVATQCCLSAGRCGPGPAGRVQLGLAALCLLGVILTLAVPGRPGKPPGRRRKRRPVSNCQFPTS